ncbi:hypothetical protein [Lachnobacterium bovis]|uniref:hypothetical protein n=1 Tax=Lachnobacterium bovis TaxID=140626 RepID=UPI000490F774|nr:hypothetical protein [Lachnobacterium bovis]
MIRGLKKKLLIGLLSAAVVGTSLAPNVPLVGSFAQEVKAEDSKLPEGMYKYTEETVSAVSKDNVYKWPSPEKKHYSLSNGTYTEITEDLTSSSKGFIFTEAENGGYVFDTGSNSYRAKESGDTDGPFFTRSEETAVVDKDHSTYEWPTSVVGKYKKDGNSYEKIENKEGVGVVAEKGVTVKVYTKEKDNTKSSVTVEKSTDTKSTVTPTKIGQTNIGAGDEAKKPVVIDRNTSTEVTVEVKASKAGQTIKSVIAKVIDANNKQIGSDITATKVDGTKDTYKLLITAAEDTVKVLIVAEEEDLLITPKLSNTLSSKVGTAELTSTAAVKPGKEFKLKVTLAEGAKESDVTVVANDKKITGSLEDRVITYSIGTDGVTDKELEIEVSGRLDNDGLEKTKTDKGSTATVENKGDAAADANDVLNVAKADQGGKSVNAKLNISTSDKTKTTALESEVELVKKSGLKLAGYISIEFLRTVSDTPIDENAPEPTEKVTKLGAPLAVKYFLPKAAIGKTGYKAIRFHDTIGEITTTPNADGEYIEVKGDELILHVKLLSDFAVVYNDTDATPDVPDPDPVPKPDPDPTPVKPDPTPVKPNPVKPSSDTGTKAAKVTTSTKKSSKTSSPKTADYAVNSLLALLTGAAGLFGITLVNKKRKEDEE